MTGRSSCASNASNGYKTHHGGKQQVRFPYLKKIPPFSLPAMNPTEQLFKHTALDTSGNGIRLVRVSPSISQTICCTMEQFNVDSCPPSEHCRTPGVPQAQHELLPSMASSSKSATIFGNFFAFCNRGQNARIFFGSTSCASTKRTSMSETIRSD